MKEKLVVVALVNANKGSEDLLRQGLMTLVEAAPKEPGFVQYDLHESIENPGQFLFYEIWEDENALNVHNNTEAMKAFGAKAGQWIQSVTLTKYKRLR